MHRIAILILLIQFLSSQERLFRHYTVEDGLSQNSVYGIVQDSSDFVWFTTADGVNRFDGYSFTVFRPIPDNVNSIPNTFTRSVEVSTDGHLWFSHVVGLSSYDLRKNSFSNIDVRSNSVLQLNIQNVVIDHDQKIWCNTVSGIFRMDNHDSSFAQIPIISFDGKIQDSVIVMSVFNDRQGETWAGTKSGIFKFDPERSAFLPFNSSAIGSIIVRCFFEDANGILWVGTVNNLIIALSKNRKEIKKYSINEIGQFSFSVNSIVSIAADRSGIIWFGSYENGLFSFDPNTLSMVQFKHNPDNPKSLGFDIVRKLFIDRNDNLWIGTDGGGISVTQLFPKQFHLVTKRTNKKNSLSDNFIKGIYQDADDIIWIGTLKGLNKYDLRKDVNTVYLPYPERSTAIGNQVLKISDDTSGTLWLGTSSGFSSFNKRKNTFTHFPDLSPITGVGNSQVTSFVQRFDTTIWLATFGVVTFNTKTNRFTKPPIVSEKFNNMIITFIYWDSRGSLWVSTFFDGLFMYDPTKDTWKNFLPILNDPSSISSVGIRGIYEESPGVLWIGTTNGLNRYDGSTDSFTRFFEKDGLPNSFVYGILPDEKGNLWMSTNRGLSKFNPTTKIFRNYSIDDGLQSSEFNTGAFYRNPLNGMMFFGGIGGVTYFHPDSITDSQFSPPIVLTDLKIFDRIILQTLPFHFMKEIELPYNENTITFSYAAIDFSNPKQIRYFYRLDGFETDWINAGTRRDVRYTNLSDGTYSLRVRATNADGVLGKNELTIRVVIIPPVWKRWWFVLLTIITIIGSVVSVIRYYFSRKVRKQIEHYAQEKEKLEERMRIRDKIARDLHDDLASTVGSAGLFIETAKRTLGENFEQTKEYLDKTSSILNEAEEAMSDIVWSVSPKHDTLQGLATRIRLVTTDLCRAHGILSLVHVNGSLEMSLTDDIRRGIYLVFKEVLNNSLKHSKATSITIWVGEENNRLTLRVKDNGIGFSLTEQKEKLGGNGMNNILIRAEEIGAEIQITSLIGEGTTILLEKQMTQLSH